MDIIITFVVVIHIFPLEWTLISDEQNGEKKRGGGTWERWCHLENIRKSSSSMDTTKRARSINGDLSGECFNKWLRPNLIGPTAAGWRWTIKITTTSPPSSATGGRRGGGRHNKNNKMRNGTPKILFFFFSREIKTKFNSQKRKKGRKDGKIEERRWTKRCG